LSHLGGELQLLVFRGVKFDRFTHQ
jgi:hypothetical protein